MRTAWLASILLLATFEVACGGGDDTIDVGGNAGNRSPNGQAGRDGRDDAGVSGLSGRGGGEEDGSVPIDGGSADPAAPQIDMLAPAPARDPNADDVVTDTTIKVRCRVTKSTVAAARDVDQSSVSIHMVATADPEQLPVVGAVNALPDSEFEAEFQLADLPNGLLSFRCSATDVGMPKLTGTGTVDTFLDLGPRLTILDPADDTIHALTSPVLIKFQVNAAPVSDDDDEAAYTDVRLEVIDQEFAATEDPTQAGLYTASVDFDDRTLFAMAPSGAEIVVTAKSSRTPVAPTRSASSSITIDAEGPAIAIGSPKNLSIVRGQVELVISITDPSGVQPDSVIGTINNGQHVLDNWEVNAAGTVYRHEFDTRVANFNMLTQLTINVWARDTVGNESTISHVLRLDNVAPILSLDPPRFREWRTVMGNRQCSMHFDPVGDDATSDLDVVYASSLYRALVNERTNTSPGAVTSWHAGVDPATMRLYAQGDDAIPLLIDSDGDDACDTINFEALDDDYRPVELTLSAVNDRGSSFFAAAPEFDSSLHIQSGSCVAGTAPNPPNALCPGTSLTRSLPQTLESDPPALYAFAPISSSDAVCAGDSWELLPSVGEGWACLAARVADNIGNVGVSPPIRVCIDDLVGPPPPCVDPVTNPPPNCTDGCASLDFTPNTEWFVH